MDITRRQNRKLSHGAKKRVNDSATSAVDLREGLNHGKLRRDGLFVRLSRALFFRRSQRPRQMQYRKRHKHSRPDREVVRADSQAHHVH